METLLYQLTQSPRMNVIVREAQTIMREEQKKREEFYRTITEQQKAEFINGEIIIHSPVRLIHDNVSGRLYKLISDYAEVHDLGITCHEKVMISLTRNDYEPDICFFSAGKANNFTDNQMKFPAPDFIAEILSSTTEKYDRGIKFEDYALHNVKEYWIIDPEKQTIEQYLLEDTGKYQLKRKFSKGNIHSQTIKGFVIAVKALFNKNEYLKAIKKQ